MLSSYFSTYFSQDLEELYIFQEIPERNFCKKASFPLHSKGTRGGHREPPHTVGSDPLWPRLLGVSPGSLWSSHPGLCWPQTHRLVLLSIWNTLSLTFCPLPFRQDRLTFTDRVNKVTRPPAPRLPPRTSCHLPAFFFSMALITCLIPLWDVPEGQRLLVCLLHPCVWNSVCHIWGAL